MTSFGWIWWKKYVLSSSKLFIMEYGSRACYKYSSILTIYSLTVSIAVAAHYIHYVFEMSIKKTVLYILEKTRSSYYIDLHCYIIFHHLTF